MGAKYISDHTLFIAELKKKNPQVEEGQREGRSIFWDKRVDRDEARRFQQSELQQPAYVYQNYVGPSRDPNDKSPADTVTPGTPATNKS